MLRSAMPHVLRGLVCLFACVRASVSYRVLIGGDFLTSEDLLAVGDLYRRLVRPELVRERANAVRACAQPLARVRLRAGGCSAVDSPGERRPRSFTRTRSQRL